MRLRLIWFVVFVVLSNLRVGGNWETPRTMVAPLLIFGPPILARNRDRDTSCMQGISVDDLGEQEPLATPIPHDLSHLSGVGKKRPLFEQSI